MEENRTRRTYKPPTEITTELKMKGIVSLTYIVVVFLMLFLAQRAEGIVYEPFKIAWYIYNALVGIALCKTTEWNGEKRLFQSILLLAFKDDSAYISIPNPKKYEKM